MLRFIKGNKEFAILFSIAVIIRFLPAFRYQYSYDELCGLRNSIYSNWYELIEYGVKLDTHPILVQLIINAVVSVFGNGEFWVKLPFLLFSLGSIVYAYLFSLKWYGKLPALIAASIFSFSYIFLFYAPLARMYSGGAFFCTALTYYLFELSFSETKKTKHYVLFVGFILAAALNNHLSCLYAFTCGAAGLTFQNRKTILKYLAACLVAVILYLPHLSITMAQFAQGGIGHSQDGWLAAPDKWALFGLLKTLLGTGYVWILFAVLIVIGFMLNKELKVNKKTVLLVILFFVNFFLIYFYSIFKAPIFQYSVMLFSAPCFIWAATGMIKLEQRWLVFVWGIVSVALIFQSVIVKRFLINAVLNENGFQSEEYCKLEDEYGKGKLESYYMGSQRFFVINYELKYKRKFNYYIAEDFRDISAFKNRLKNSKADHVLLGEPTILQLEIAKEYFPHKIQHKQNLNVNCYLLSKKRIKARSTCLPPNPLVLLKMIGNKKEKILSKSTVFSSGSFLFGFNKDKMLSGNLKVDSIDEFCLSAKSQLRSLNPREGNTLLAKIKVNSSEQLNDVGFNYSVSDDRDSTLFFGGTDIGQFYTSDSTGYYAYSELFLGSDLKHWLARGGKVTFFIWNRSKRKFELRDFEIQLIDYWPSRWSWWE